MGTLYLATTALIPINAFFVVTDQGYGSVNMPPGEAVAIPFTPANVLSSSGNIRQITFEGNSYITPLVSGVINLSDIQRRAGWGAGPAFQDNDLLVFIPGSDGHYEQVGSRFDPETGAIVPTYVYVYSTPPQYARSKYAGRPPVGTPDLTYITSPRMLLASFEVTAAATARTFNFRDTTEVSHNVTTWEFGDGATGSGVRVFHRYPQPGEYTVTMRVSPDREQSDSLSRIITVPEPTPSGMPNPPTIRGPRASNLPPDLTPGVIPSDPGGATAPPNWGLLLAIAAAIATKE